jgi:hypothetical protein
MTEEEARRLETLILRLAERVEVLILAVKRLEARDTDVPTLDFQIPESLSTEALDRLLKG